MGQATRLLERTRDRYRATTAAARRCLTRVHDTLISNVVHFNGGAALSLIRIRPRSGSATVERCVRIGPNHVHAFITHPDGTIKDLGVSKNLLTNIGRDWFAQTFGGFIPAGGGAGPATATSATSITGTGSVWTASNLATPQLGLAGMRVYASLTGVTTAPCYGNIISNTTNVATIDKWWTAADGTATTPASTNGFIIGAGGAASARFIALTTDASAASASNTVLTSEITTAGAGRALGTYAHTYGAATYTLTKAFSITGTLTAIHRAGCFATLSAAGADPMIFESVISQDATVGNGDTLTLSWTFTCSG